MEPVAFVGKTLNGLPKVKGADIACGAGRYDLLLFKYLKYLKNLHLTCIDINESMLEQASNYLRYNGITNFKTSKAVNGIPLEDNSMNCVFSFNAIHHFDFVKFINKTGRAIKNNGRIFIYTRSRSQNSRNIWGRHFPLFAEKETRLHELNDMKQWVQSHNSLDLEMVKPFKYQRKSSFERLVEKVKAKHYSTFSFYEDAELEEALKGFKKNINEQYQDTSQIEWFDENILLVLKPKSM